MKEFSYEWSEENYLIHVQFNSVNPQKPGNGDVIVHRIFNNGKNENETRTITNEGFRFIISRSCPEECKVIIEYDDMIIMKVFQIDDRAYYPTSTFYEG